MNRNRLILLIVIAFFLSPIVSCKKFLDAKPDKSLVIPTTLNDLQAILDYSIRINEGTSFGEASADNYYLIENDFNAFPDDLRKTYTWDNYAYSNYPNDWARVYDVIYPANLVLEGIEEIPQTSENRAEWNNIKGSALVFRAVSYLQGAFTFCKSYDRETADDDLGMVLRLKSDFNATSKERSSVRRTYDQIIGDLQNAVSLLPPTPVHPMRPSKAAAFGLLARTYLSMNEYDSCLKYANLCLNIKNDLFDFNTLEDLNANFAFPEFNKEVIMVTQTRNAIYYSIIQPYGMVDSLLYESYGGNDLRKYAFFLYSPPGYNFKGSYSGISWAFFTGIATDEVYLMRAECYARNGEIDAAMESLNTVLAYRWKTGTFEPLKASTPSQAVDIILRERRKELLFRNLRWMDIKRLNKIGANITLLRKVNGTEYKLEPNDNRFALPLPYDIIRITGIVQNPK